ncbi:unnamed protein product [Caenorhabditis auriculariae]|uniref:Uncharacterized protein n=1 Tax=Caenorhabditis auriculariae TaxID=2777116 RepID=A0A8S1HAB3_9PELO|nr:unnamed protein product [Caenorhabditis auriculariae]
MAEDQLLNFSGDTPDDVIVLGETDPELLQLNDTLATTISTILNTTVLPTSSFEPLLPYTPNPFRIGFLAVKCLLIVLLCAISCTIRRDFLKFFAICILIPLFLEAAFDVFTEIQAGTGIFGVQKLEWAYHMVEQPVNSTISDYPKHAIDIYGAILQQYSTYQLYTGDPLFALASFIIADFVFWSLLFSTVVAFYYAHKSIVRPERIVFEPFILSFLKAQLIPVLFTAVDTLLALHQVPGWVYSGAMVVVRLGACLVAVAIATQLFASLFLFCRSVDELSVTSPYEQIRNAKMRLFLLLLFTVVVHLLSAPYIAWAGISLVRDVMWLLSFDTTSLPLRIAAEAFPLHLTLFLIRPLVFLVASLFFLNPFRRRFVRLFCPCCRRK